MGTFSIWHWLVVLVIVVLVFGTKRLKNVGRDVGEAVKGFKQGLSTEDEQRRELTDERKVDGGTAERSAEQDRERDGPAGR